MLVIVAEQAEGAQLGQTETVAQGVSQQQILTGAPVAEAAEAQAEAPRVSLSPQMMEAMEETIPQVPAAALAVLSSRRPALLAPPEAEAVVDSLQ